MHILDHRKVEEKKESLLSGKHLCFGDYYCISKTLHLTFILAGVYDSQNKNKNHNKISAQVIGTPDQSIQGLQGAWSLS